MKKIALLILALSLVIGIANAAPPQIDSFNPTSPIIVDEGTITPVSIYFSDPDGDPLTVSIYYDGELVDPTASNITITPNYAKGDFYPDSSAIGNHNIKVTVSDGTSEVFQEWDVTVNDVNIAPKITFPSQDSKMKFFEDFNSGLFAISAVDADGDPITYSASNLPSGATFDPLTHMLLWTPTAGQRGEYQITLTASDGALSSSIDLILVVNRPPVIENFDPSSELTISEGDSLTLSQDVTDADGDQIMYSWILDGTPVSDRNYYTYSPDYNSQGNHVLEFIATDGKLSTNKIWTVIVNDVNPPSGGGGGGSSNVESSAGMIVIAPETPSSMPLSEQPVEETKNKASAPQTVQEQSPITGFAILTNAISNNPIISVLVLILIIALITGIYWYKKH
ncbi:MAG: Ig-like domain-containing protein [Nanoarchaeota archaeon]